MVRRIESAYGQCAFKGGAHSSTVTTILRKIKVLYIYKSMFFSKNAKAPEKQKCQSRQIGYKNDNTVSATLGIPRLVLVAFSAFSANFPLAVFGDFCYL